MICFDQTYSLSVLIENGGRFIMFETFGGFTAAFSAMTFISVLGIVFREQIDAFEDRFDAILRDRKARKGETNHG